MKKQLLSLLLPLLAAATATAAPVTYADALATAKAFMQAKGATINTQRQPMRAPRRAAAKDSYYYVFNADNSQGFVVVSGDDRTEKVLGYADRGSLNTADMPENVRSFLQAYADEIESLDKTATAAPRRVVEKARHAVLPLLTSTWNQDAPYNDATPTYTLNYSDGTSVAQHCVTGCVATAMAQAMGYYRHPARLTAQIPAYTCQSSHYAVAAQQAGSVIDWSNILPSYGSTATPAQDTAVARLMLYAGAAVQMDYTRSESGASGTDIAPALRNYFDYSCRYIDRGDYSLEGFEGVLYDEVSNHRPVIFCGSSTGGGHCFVIDGYDGDGRFHINWGWGGMSNGYFLIADCNPGSTAGIGASSTSDGYSISQAAVIGLTPGAGQEPAQNLGMSVRLGAISGSSVSVSLYNYTGATHSFEFAMAVIGADGSVTPVRSQDYYGNTQTVYSFSDLPSSYGFNRQLGLGSTGLSAGTYTVAVVSRLQGATEWTYTSSQLLTLTIGADGSATVTKAIDVSNLSVAQWALTGSKTAGTAQPVTITVNNAGGEYYGTVCLLASASSTMPSQSSSMTGLTAKANGTTDITMSFTPSSAGTWHLWFCYVTYDYDSSTRSLKAVYNPIGTTTVEIGAAPSSSNVSLSASYDYGVSYDYAKYAYMMYGKKLSMNAKVTNSGRDDFNGQLMMLLWDSNHQGNIDMTYVDASVPAGQTVSVPINFDVTPSTSVYYYVGCYYNNSSLTQYSGGPILVNPAIFTYASDGTMTTTRPQASYAVPATASAVDFSGLEDTLKTVTPNANPNTLYYFSKPCAATSALQDAGRNVVVNGTASQLTLADGSDFYAPAAFTAVEAAYTRKPVIGTSGNGGWETLSLPFAASTVRGEGFTNDLRWFTSDEDAGKDFWLMQFYGVDGTTVMFDYVQDNTVPANTPLIIAVPGDRWGSQYSLVNKQLTFTGNNVTIGATSDAPAMDATSIYKFIGTTATATPEGTAYVLDTDQGTAFNATAPASVAAFRAYFAPGNAATQESRAKALRIATRHDDGSATTAIVLQPAGQPAGQPAANAQAEAAYNIAGQRVDKAYKGVVIQRGKKVVRH